MRPNPIYKEFTNLGWETHKKRVNTIQIEIRTGPVMQALCYGRPKEQLLLIGMMEVSSLIYLSTSYVPGISTLIAKVSPVNKTENLPAFMEFTF